MTERYVNFRKPGFLKYSVSLHFTVVYSVTWPLNGSEAGGDPALIQTSLLLLCN